MLTLCLLCFISLYFSLTIWMFLGWRVCRWKVSLMKACAFVKLVCFFAWRSLHALPDSFQCLWQRPKGPYEKVFCCCSDLHMFLGCFCFISGMWCSAWTLLIVWHLNTSPESFYLCVSVGRPTEWPVTNQQLRGVASPPQHSGRSSACSENSSHCSC